MNLHIDKNLNVPVKKVLMVVYNYFPGDVRPRREAEALINNGYSVDIVCVGLEDQLKSENNVWGTDVYRIIQPKKRASKSTYILEYLTFFLRSFFIVTRLYRKKKYDVVHVHNMPDFLVFVGILPKFFGARIILDLHDPSPEVFMTKFDSDKDNFFIKILKWQEKVSINFAHVIITTNKSFLERFVSRNCPSEKINIVMNSPQESVFEKYMDINNKKQNGKFVLMYHGFIVERHGLDILIKSIKKLENRIPGLELAVFGDGGFVPKFLELVSELNLRDKVKYFGPKPLEDIAKQISEINLGVIPNRITPFTQINFPVRIFEYICLKKSVIVPRTQGIRDYFSENSINYFDPDSENDLADVIYRIYSNPEKSKEILLNGYKVYQNYSWSKQSNNLLDVYRRILN